MGTDQKQLYRVTRIGQPPELGDWAQEFGRAGRDGLPAVASLLWQRGRGMRIKPQMKEFIQCRSCLRMQVVKYYNPSVDEESIRLSLVGDCDLERAANCCIVCLDGAAAVLVDIDDEGLSDMEVDSERTDTDEEDI